jgi:hypothetical protein
VTAEPPGDDTGSSVSWTGSPAGPTRRGVLALLGSAAVAGCSGLPNPLASDRSVTVSGSELAAIASRDAPAAPETIPVEIAQAHLDAARTRARDLLSTAPDPLGPDEIPNGAIRERVASRRERARSDLEEASEAGSPFEAMGHLRSARCDARYLAAAWKAVDEGLTRETLFESAPAISEDAAAFRERWRYVGGDPVRALVVHQPIERLAETAGSDATPPRESLEREQENPITVGELAADLERARASLSDAAHLYDRFLDTLDEHRDLGPTFEGAVDEIAEAIDERRGDLPSVDPSEPSELVERDVEGTPVGWALERFYADLVDPPEFEREHWEGNPTGAILRGHESLAKFRAFESLRDRVDGGEEIDVENAADIGRMRTDAIEAIEGARASDRQPLLTRGLVSNAADGIGYVDEELARVAHGGGEEGEVRETVEVDWFVRDVARYLQIAAMARAAPAASEQVATILRSA